MTAPLRGRPPRHMRCPVCADEFVWPDDPLISLHDERNDRYEVVDVSALPQAKRDNLVRKGYRLCPNPSEDTAEHYLPATYADYGDPLVIGLVGAPISGKTHLLTAMIRQAYLNGLTAHGVTVSALDFRRHKTFRDDFIVPFERGDALAGTGNGIVEAADILLLRGPGGQRPVTFFDVAGEDLESTDPRVNRFLIATTAVIFVHASEDPLETGQSSAASENGSFEQAIGQLSGNQLPAVIAVTKSDRLRYVPPAERWLHRGDETDLNADRIRAETRDVYAYLHHVGAAASLRPFDEFSRCTLHFVSASGGDAVPIDPKVPSKKHFPHGFHPTRVLEPLVSILAMTGMITGPEARKVGMP
ncbi:hypothetical protein ALI22I_28730 [Saccharothrix sp. ALI-22-I]|uniref:hypothetical protein n=1 Tax=Saccharothrix sp. ALI-22-I TaxID=1933778 RepID=UPI00097BE77F|nr:hypothetical protein [Saccharothrix sp. ALI-22-I]ONI84542.1 hypothetical protein ALI22I_28730 [Saccharothrix sp. ALI-22-I]